MTHGWGQGAAAFRQHSAPSACFSSDRSWHPVWIQARSGLALDKCRSARCYVRDVKVDINNDDVCSSGMNAERCGGVL